MGWANRATAQSIWCNVKKKVMACKDVGGDGGEGNALVKKGKGKGKGKGRKVGEVEGEVCSFLCLSHACGDVKR